MIIREVKKEEYREAQKLYCLCFNKECESINLELLGNLIGIYEANVLIGVSQIDYFNNILDDKRIAYINSFCIHPDYRNKGLGSKLINECINICKNNNCDYINLTSNSKKIEANRLYIKNGFKLIDTNIYRKDIL